MFIQGDPKVCVHLMITIQKVTSKVQSVPRHTAAIQERVTAVLLSIPKEAFADSFQILYERCQPCVVKDDDYFEGQSI
jgi:hypothetical protein